jgi:endonuclease YncB( thermonuclease family)
MKDVKAAIFIIIVVILTIISAHAQRRFDGRVVEIIDGKTFVIQMPAGRVTAVLQYIEIPEPEQPLYQMVKDHLQNLIFDKIVEFQPRIVMKDKTVGQLLMKGVDVSQQMLRDGAAWYSVAEKNGQESNQNELYLNNESQAKAEKRGVWGDKNLKPAWEFRAEKERLKKEQEMLAQQNYLKNSLVEGTPQKQKKPVQRQPQVVPQAEMWADVGGTSDLNKKTLAGGLYTDYDASLRIGYICTSSIFLDIPGDDFMRKIEGRGFYLYKGDSSRVEDSIYAVAFLATSKEYRFLESTGLTITVDKQKIVLPLAKRFFRENYESVQELMLYKMTRAQLTKIANAKTISLKLGTYSGGISSDSLTYINNLLNTSR